MTDMVKDLLEQLDALSPMPDDDDASIETLQRYEEIVEQLVMYNDPRCIQPLIESFGYIDGYGLYWSTMHLIETFAVEETSPLLIKALNHENKGTRLWATRMLMRSQNNEVFPKLITLLADEAEHVRAEAALALSGFGELKARGFLERLRDDSSEEVRSTVIPILAEWNQENG